MVVLLKNFKWIVKPLLCYKAIEGGLLMFWAYFNHVHFNQFLWRNFCIPVYASYSSKLRVWVIQKEQGGRCGEGVPLPTGFGVWRDVPLSRENFLEFSSNNLKVKGPLWLLVVHRLTAMGHRWRHNVVVSALASINVVNRHWARLVLGWVTVCGRVNHLGM